MGALNRAVSTTGIHYTTRRTIAVAAAIFMALVAGLAGAQPARAAAGDPVVVLNYSGTVKINEGESITFDASKSSSPLGEALDFVWLQDGDFAPTSNRTPIFKADLTPGNHTMQVWVQADSGATWSEKVVIEVGPERKPQAVLNPSTPQNLTLGSSIVFDGYDSKRVNWGRCYFLVDGKPVESDPMDYRGRSSCYQHPDGMGWFPELTYKPTELGLHTVTLGITDPAGVSDEVSVEVTVVAPPKPVARISPDRNYVVESGSYLRFDADGSKAADGGPLTYAWYLPDSNDEDGVVDTGSRFYPHFPMIGKSRVRLVVTDQAGQTSEASVTVTTEDNASSCAEVVDQQVNVGATVRFGGRCWLDNQGAWDLDYASTKYSWRTTGLPGVVATSEFYSRKFDKPGRYGVQLNAVDADGNATSKRIVVTAKVPVPNKPPVAVFTPSTDQSVKVGTKVKFDGWQSSDPDGGALTYRWYTTGIGGAVSKTSSYARTFTKPGKYRVRLEVIDKAGAKASKTVEITVAHSMPLVSVSPNFLPSVTPGSRVVFGGSDSVDPDGGSLSYRWYTTGIKGAVSTTSSYARRFTKPGKYRVRLEVTDDEGGMASETQEITVSESAEPLASINTVEEVTYVVGETASFSNWRYLGLDFEPVKNRWYVTGTRGVASSAESYDLRFTKAGRYRVKLVASDGMGNRDSDTVELTVLP